MLRSELCESQQLPSVRCVRPDLAANFACLPPTSSLQHSMFNHSYFPEVRILFRQQAQRAVVYRFLTGLCDSESRTLENRLLLCSPFGFQSHTCHDVPKPLKMQRRRVQVKALGGGWGGGQELSYHSDNMMSYRERPRMHGAAASCHVSLVHFKSFTFST
jgi:hypothetical protein